MLEAELSPTVKQFLIEQGCTELHGEVLDVDLVGIKGSVIFGVEMKTSLNTKVLEQALKRKNLCHMVYVAVPYSKVKSWYSISVVYKQFLENNGIGIITIKESKVIGDKTYYFYEVLKHAKLNRKPRYKISLLNSLTDLTRNQDGGLTSDKVVSPYKIMIEQVKEYLMRVRNDSSDGWKTLDDILKACPKVSTHYSSPKGGLYQTITARYNSSWVEIDIKAKKYRYLGSEDSSSVLF